MITQQEFDKLKVGDVLVFEENEVIVELKTTNSILLYNKKNQLAEVRSLSDLNRNNYSLKPKGQAIKCENYEQFKWVCNKLDNLDNQYQPEIYFYKNFNCISLDNKFQQFTEKYANENNYQIITFSDYCKEQNIEEPKRYCGFEVRDYSKEFVVVSVSNLSIDNCYNEVFLQILKKVKENCIIDKEENDWKYAIPTEKIKEKVLNNKKK